MTFRSVALGMSALFYVAAVFLLTPLPGFSKLTYLGLAGMGVSLLLFRAEHRLVRALDLPVLLAGVFATLAVASILWATDPVWSVINTGSTLTGLVGGVLIYLSLQNGMWYGWVVAGAVIGGAVEGLVAVQDVFSGAALRAEGLTTSPNLLGFLLSVSGLLILAWRERPRLLTVLAVTFVVIATLTSGSRTVIFIWVGMGIIGSWYLGRMRWRQRAAVALATLGMVGVATFFALRSTTVQAAIQSFYLLQRLQNLASAGDTSIRERVWMARDAVDVWYAAPIWGHGIGQFRIVGPWMIYAHNNYLELLTGLGVIGLLAYTSQHVVLLYRSLRPAHASLWRFRFVLAGTMVLLLWDIGTVAYYEKSTWLLLGVMWFMARRERGEESSLTSTSPMAALP